MMQAHAGDLLVMDGENGDRVAVILGSRSRDGAPPYIVRWLADGHVTLAFPGPYARLLPGNSGAQDGNPESVV